MTKEIMSIRLSADGLSFWLGNECHGGTEVYVNYTITGAGRNEIESVREAVTEYKGILEARGKVLPGDKIVWADTLFAVLVPEEVFIESDSRRYMDLHGFRGDEGTYTVCSKPLCGTVAVMELPKAIMETLGQSLGEFSVAHIAQYNIIKRPVGDLCKHIRIYLSNNICHIAVFGESGMVVADSYPYTSLADINYYISAIIQSHEMGDSLPVYIRGDRADETARLLSRTYKSVVCG